MTPERWRKIEELFQAAVARPLEERNIFLDEACAGDGSLRREVAALLASDHAGESRLEEIASGVAAGWMAESHSRELIGQCLGHYEIIASLGSGGMGEVYLARDEQLGRKVALKLLPKRLTADETQLSRFKIEARTASALNHPNIVTIHEIGEVDGTHYIATEFIDGTTLRQRMAHGLIPPHEALEIARQIASALCVAHEAGIVHRDIKPENIMLRRDGFAKVLDFGIAKLTAVTTRVTSAGASVTTQPGMILGTTRYMSPEQARGNPVEAQSDVWSLGVVLYEMLAGGPPFDGETPTDVLAAVLLNDPQPLRQRLPTVPPALQSVVEKSLRKDPTQRYQTAEEMLVQLRATKENSAHIGARPIARKVAAVFVFMVLIAAAWIAFQSGRTKPAKGTNGLSTSKPDMAAAPLTFEKSVALLPFENRTRDTDNAYFAEGIQDEILTRLSKIADLKVISRTSTQHYKSAPENLAEIAKQLGVAHIVEGSVQQSGDAVRVHVQLMKAASDSPVWAETFDRKLTDLFTVESEVAKAIAEQLRAKITGQEQQVIASRPTENPEAHDAYLRGLAYSLRTNTVENVQGAQKHLREAVRLDPKFALAWALLARVNSTGYISGVAQRTPALREEARQAAETALALQPQLGEALHAKGYYHYACLKDYETAVRYYEQARPLLPNSSRVPEGLAYVARRRAEWDKSESYFNEAEGLDPRNVSLLYQHALTYGALRRLPEAERKLDQVLDITPDDSAAIAQKAGYIQAQGDLSRAANLLDPLRPSLNNSVLLAVQIRQATFERRAGPPLDRAREILVRPDPTVGFLVGEFRVLLAFAQDAAGDRAAAVASWRQASNELEGFLKEQPENHWIMGELALAHAALGEKGIAMDLIQRAKAAFPIEKDMMAGLAVIEFEARVAAQTGEADRAIAALEKLLSTRYGTPMASQNVPLTPALLRLDPIFDPLRNDPRFRKLASGK